MARPDPQRREIPWSEPWLLCRRLAQRLGNDGLVLLEGDGSRLGRRAVLAVDPCERWECRGLPGEPGAADPFAALTAAAEGGSWLGWLGYEAAAWSEPARHWRSSEMASLWCGRFDPLIHFDRAARRCWLEGREPARLARLAALAEALAGPTRAKADDDQAGAAGRTPGLPAAAWHWHTTPERYAEQVRQLQRWIAAGDLFQANLTACCQTELAAPPDPLALYARLRRRCPAPFAALAVAGEEAVVSASPERFLRCDPHGAVETRPIKGT
ncbi:MAG: chorismate-binding protein, partial [Cyanobium sp.]